MCYFKSKNLCIKNQLKALLFLSAMMPIAAQAVIVSADLEVVTISNVGNTFQLVNLENTYTTTIPVCTYNLPSSSAIPAVVRIQNITSTSFEVKVQRAATSGTESTDNVYCVISEAGEFTVQIHVSGEEFKRMTKNLSIGNNLAIINIETPLHGKDLRYANGPDDPIEWRTETNNWVHIEECKFEFEFCNHIKKGQESKKAKKVDDAPVYQEIEKLQQITQGINSILSTINSKLTVVVATLIAIALVLAFK